MTHISRKERIESEKNLRQFRSDWKRNFERGLVRQTYHPEAGHDVFQTSVPHLDFVEPFVFESEAHAFVQGAEKMRDRIYGGK